VRITDRDFAEYCDELTQDHEREEPDADDRYQLLAEEPNLQHLQEELEAWTGRPVEPIEPTEEELNALPY
jgi:hypothetical protein